MMLRVRPAQCTTMVASGSGARSAMCITTSPLGALLPPGMVARRCSSGVRESRSTIFSPFCWRAWSSSGCSSGTPCTTCTFSPKSLLGTFTPHSVGWPSVAQRLMPPSSTATWRKPMRSRVAAARRARRPSSSHTTIPVARHGTRPAMRNSSCRRGTRLAPGMCESLYSPASRTSMRAQVAWASSRSLRVDAVILSVMVDWAPGLEDRRSVTASVAELYSGGASPSSAPGASPARSGHPRPSPPVSEGEGERPHSAAAVATARSSGASPVPVRSIRMRCMKKMRSTRPAYMTARRRKLSMKASTWAWDCVSR